MTLSKTLRFAATAFVLSLALPTVSALAVYTPPLNPPPTCNAGDPGCDAPIHTGEALQVKEGALVLGLTAAELQLFFDNPDLQYIEDHLAHFGFVVANKESFFGGTVVATQGIDVQGMVSDYWLVNPGGLTARINGKVGAVEYCDINGENCSVPPFGGNPGINDTSWPIASSTNDLFPHAVYFANAVAPFLGGVAIGTTTVPFNVRALIENNSNDAVLTDINHPISLVSSASGNNGTAIQATAYGPAPNIPAITNPAMYYAGKFISEHVGTFSRGRIATYSSVRSGGSPVLNNTDSGWFASSTVVAARPLAGFFDGPVRISDYQPGTPSPVNLQVNGKVGARAYCDEQGNNCIDTTVVGDGIKRLNQGAGVLLSPNPILSTSPNASGTVAIDFTAVQHRITASCPAGSAIRDISQTGVVTCEDDNLGTFAGTSISCPAGQYISSINTDDGTVVCATDNGGDSTFTVASWPWASTSPTSNNIYNRAIGNVGIGTTTPNQKLTVAGTFSSTGGLTAGGRLSITTPNGDIGIVVNTDNQNFRQDIRFPDAGGIEFAPSAGTGIPGVQVKINPNGNVGIGTPTPGAKLEVAGQVKITGGTPGLGKVLQSDATGLASWVATSSLGINGTGGGVTSVDLTAPGIFTVTGGPVTGAGTLGFTLNSQNAGTVLAAPAGANGVPTFRALTDTDIPATVKGSIVGGAGVTITNGTDRVLGATDVTISAVAPPITTTSWPLASTTAANGVYFGNSVAPFGGNVGIGTTTPSVKLAVEGNTLINGSLTSRVNRLIPRVSIEGDPNSDFSPNGLIYYQSPNPSTQIGVDGGKFRCKQNGAWTDCAGGSLWETDPLIAGGIKNKTTGTVRVGTYNPTDDTGYGAVFGRQNGIEAYTLGTSGNGAVSAYGRGVGAMGLLAQSEGNTTQLQNYGAKVLSSDVGSLSRGNTIGIYATNKGGIADVTRGTADGDTAKIDAGTFAGYFDGPVQMYSTDKKSGVTVGGDMGNALQAYVLGANGIDQQNTTAAINTAHSGNFGIGFVGHAYGGGTTYGSKSIAGTVGAMARGGKIGLYATNQGGTPGSPSDSGWFAPPNVLSGPSYAAVINGPTWIADTVNGNGAEDPNTGTVSAGAGLVIASTSHNGAEAYTFYPGKAALTGYAKGAGAVGIEATGDGAGAYGARLFGVDYGSLIRGNKVGLYASTDPADSAVPTALLSPDPITGSVNPTYAGLFKGKVRATGDICTDLAGGKCLSTIAGGAGLTGGVANAIPKWTSATAIGNSQITDTGLNVGIGTNAPAQKLHVNGSIYGGNYFTNANAGYWMGGNNAFNYGVYQPTSADRVSVRSGGTDRLTVLSNGNVGINRTTPVSSLDVGGQIYGDAVVGGYLSAASGGTYAPIYLKTNAGGAVGSGANYRLQADSAVSGQGKSFGVYSDDAGAWRLFINGVGNVGIGNTAPVAKLDITGNIKIADGTQGVGKVLTSDGAGLATWQTPTGGITPTSFYTTSSTGSNEATATCDAGDVAVGGGAKFNDNDTSPDLLSRPGTATDVNNLSNWYCTQSKPDGALVCYARCMDFAPTR